MPPWLKVVLIFLFGYGLGSGAINLAQWANAITQFVNALSGH